MAPLSDSPRTANDRALLELLESQTPPETPLEDTLGRLFGLAVVLALAGNHGLSREDLRTFLHRMIDDAFTWYASQFPTGTH
jgi:hypothetical protein